MSRKRTRDTTTLDMFAEAVAHQPLTPALTLDVLRDWADAGMLRRLDVALALWLHEQFPQVQPCVLVAAAMLAHMEGRGHSCLPLNDMVVQANAVLAALLDAELEEPRRSSPVKRTVLSGSMLRRTSRLCFPQRGVSQLICICE